MDTIIQIHRERFFTVAEAQAVLPIILRITDASSDRVNTIMERLEKLTEQNRSLIEELEDEANQIIKIWQSKVRKLGAHPKGLWIADFDAGDGYFCWKFPERSIDYWHGYNDGFSRRIGIGERDMQKIHQAGEVATHDSVATTGKHISLVAHTISDDVQPMPPSAIEL